MRSSDRGHELRFWRNLAGTNGHVLISFAVIPTRYEHFERRL